MKNGSFKKFVNLRYEGQFQTSKLPVQVMTETAIPQAISSEIDKLMSLCQGFTQLPHAMHVMETSILKHLLTLGKTLLVQIVTQHQAAENTASPILVKGQKAEKKGLSARDYLSIFGMISIERQAYYEQSIGKFHPLDDLLQLPNGTAWSYNLQEIVAENASENDYNESVRTVNKILGLGLSGKSSERNIGHFNDAVDEFYEAKQPQPSLVGSCFSLSFDGKGVPKIKEKEPTPDGSLPKKRLGKGEKPNVMQMATVTVLSDFTPKPRSVENILNGLMDKRLVKDKVPQSATDVKQENDNRWHKNIHRRAFLGDQEKAVDYGMRQLKRRLEKEDGQFVVPIDAGIGLESKVLAGVKKYGLEKKFDGIVLDIVHVSEYVWDSANSIWGEGSDDRYLWVRGRLKTILEGKVGDVIKELKETMDDGKLSEARLKQVEKVHNYFTNHQSKMQYHNYLQKGYPVSSALVESACGHLVKERMEQTGMRWSTKGAQNIMDIRAIKQNENMKEFMEFFIQKQHPIPYGFAV
jgi:hypothetical protein